MIRRLVIVLAVLATPAFAQPAGTGVPLQCPSTINCLDFAGAEFDRGLQQGFIVLRNSVLQPSQPPEYALRVDVQNSRRFTVEIGACLVGPLEVLDEYGNSIFKLEKGDLLDAGGCTKNGEKQ